MTFWTFDIRVLYKLTRANLKFRHSVIRYFGTGVRSLGNLCYLELQNFRGFESRLHLVKYFFISKVTETNANK